MSGLGSRKGVGPRNNALTPPPTPAIFGKTTLLRSFFTQNVRYLRLLLKKKYIVYILLYQAKKALLNLLMIFLIFKIYIKHIAYLSRVPVIRVHVNNMIMNNI